MPRIKEVTLLYSLSLLSLMLQRIEIKHRQHFFGFRFMITDQIVKVLSNWGLRGYQPLDRSAHQARILLDLLDVTLVCEND